MKGGEFMKILYLLALLLFIYGCGHAKSDQNNQMHSQISIKDPDTSKIKESVNHSSYKNSKENVKITPVTLKENEGNQSPQKDSAMLDVILLKQNPELKYGCEVTSLAMVLNHAGKPTDKMELYKVIQKDPDPIIKAPNGDISKWGNPNDGFVGDMTGKSAGYAVFDKPMVQLINHYLPGRAVNLSNQPFENVLKHVSDGFPVVVWTTGDFRQPDRWESWYHGQQLIKTPLDLHVVVLVGYDANHVYLNDPLSGIKQAKVSKEQFITSWKALNCLAVSYK